MTGIRLLDEVKSQNAKQPVFAFMSGFSDISSMSAFSRGASAIIAKPFEPEELISTIEFIMNPIERRWGSPLSEEKDQAIPLSFKAKSFEAALKTGIIQLGHGGVFLAMDRNFPQTYEFVHFCVDFEDGVSGKVDGYGQVRWVRHDVSKSHLPGIGVEIHFLGDSCRDYLLEKIHKEAYISYIPDGKML